MIGSALCSLLGAQGHDLRCFDLAARGLAHGDVRAPADLDAAVAGCDGVVHLAAVSRVVWAEADPLLCQMTNVTGTRNVVEAIRRAESRAWLILGSSREVYGQAQLLPVAETAPLRPMNHYARSKCAAEQIIAEAACNGLRAAILRFSTVYGSSADHADRVVPAFCRAALSGAPLRLDGAETCLDITHVADVVAGIARVARALDAGRSLPPLHFTTGQGTRLAELAGMIIALAQSGSTITHAPARAYDVARFVGDPARARNLVGWSPSVRLQDGLADLLDQLCRKAGQAGADSASMR
ncbi:MAG: NAD-dependent epimerase/dehydratase family protein [Rhodobacteraceae bacterium]|nr:NAD-dependent epimerase/dehydratase family protein [Paracoccaceae bacterium]